uniref:Uncharacterized protein n=1 Tax=Caenorhabditis japonica TaxID=281687 RepID=A0A8R1J1N1_CAEJA
ELTVRRRYPSSIEAPCYLESGLQVIDSSKNFSRDLPFQHAPNAEIHRIEIRAGSRPQVLVQESREMRLQDGQCRSRAMGRCPVLLKDKWTTSNVPTTFRTVEDEI